MISKAQFDSIQMNASTRRIAEADMAAAESFVETYFAIATPSPRSLVRNRQPRNPRTSRRHRTAPEFAPRAPEKNAPIGAFFYECEADTHHLQMQ